MAATYWVLISDELMASEDHWRRTRYRPVRYHMDDAQASWQRRHQGDWQHYAAKPDE